MRPFLHVLLLLFFMLFGLAPAVESIPMDFSFTGTFSADDDVELFNFSVDVPTTITLKTVSYAGGTNAAGDLIPASGFDPTLAVFDSQRRFIAEGDDGLFPFVGIDPVTGQTFDTFLEGIVPAGSYTLALTQYDNFFSGGFGGPLSLGFLRQGQPAFTGDNLAGVPGGMFFDFTGDQRTNFWALDILGVDSASRGRGASIIPEPSALFLLGLGLVALALWKQHQAF